MHNYTAHQWLQIGLANAFGFDKLTFAERFTAIESMMFSTHGEMVEPNFDIAEEPGAAIACWDGLQGNERVRVHLDATASGTQILAAFANCRKSGTWCNLFGEDRQDAYTHAWKAMGELPGITRKMAKQAFMTSQFGSRAVPREMLGEANLPAFHAMYQREFPGVWNVLQYIQSLWQPTVHSHRWVMPDGFEVIQWNNGLQEEKVVLFGKETAVLKQVHTTEKRGIALAANVTHSTDGFLCREMVKRAQFDPQEARDTIEAGWPADKQEHLDLKGLLALYRKTQFLSIDLIVAMDSQTFYEELNDAEQVEIMLLVEHLACKEQFNLIPVHDSFSCEARYCNSMCEMYRYLMQQLWDSTLLDSIAADITGTHEAHTKHPAVLDGVHMIC